MKLNKGIRRSPSLPSDGELDYMMNLMACDGDIRNIPATEPLVITLAEGDVLLCVHKVEAVKHYVVRTADGKSLAFYHEDGSDRTIITTLTERRIDTVVAMGNTLIIRIRGLSDNSENSDYSYTAYAIWRDGAYAFLGSQFPQIDMQFRLRNIYVQTFHPGEETGIIVERSEQTETTEFAEVVAPTPVTTPEFSQETLFTLTPDQPLAASTTYKIVTSRLSGRQATPFSVYLCYTDLSRDFAAFSTAANDLHPYAVFTTDATKTVSHIELCLWANGKQAKSLSVTLLKGTATKTGHVFADTPENFNALTGMVNKFIAKYATEENKFISPFFVRYALKLYDGTYVCPSPPCLMIPNRGISPLAWTLGGTDGHAWDTYIAAVVSQLKYRLTAKNGIEPWRDLVTGVAVAVSSPVWTYNQGAEWKAGENLVRLQRIDATDEQRADDTWSYGYFDNGDGTCSATYLFNRNNSSTTTAGTLFSLTLPSFTARQVADELASRSLFYIVREIPVDELPELGGWTDVEMEEHTLTALETRRRLDDNPLSLSLRGGGCMQVYNQRLVLADITAQQFCGHCPALMQGKAGTVVNSTDGRTTLRLTKAIVSYVEEGVGHTLCVADRPQTANETPLFWFYYPSVNAQSAVIWQNDQTNRWRRAELRLSSHKLLSGACWFDNFNEPEWTDWMPYLALDEGWRAEVDMADHGAVLHHANKIQQSGVNNPFAFLPELTNTVGQTQVVTLAGATQALSEGQFGEYPLYAFCRDGIWAVQVGADGAFAAIRPLSRDRCLSARSVVQTDGAVVFATAQGLKCLSGSDISRLSASLDGWAADVELLSGIDADFNPLVADVEKDFNREMEHCGLAFDYPNNLLHVYVGESNYHYVLSLASGEWSLSGDVCRPLAVVNDYPDTVIQDGRVLRRFSNVCSSVRRKGILLTRPVDLGSPTALKRMKDMRILWRQLDAGSSVRAAVFASNNRRVWWRMRSLNSHSYRWFRIALLTDINDFERVEGVVQ